MKSKEKILFLHESSTKEKLYCLSSNQKWSELLIGKGKNYEQFLQRICQKNFFKDLESNSVTKIGAILGFKPAHITKWIAQIYDDIYELTIEEPNLFKSSEIRHDCYFHNYDNHARLSIWLPQTPRECERFELDFLKAKLGTYSFWVKTVYHHYENGEYSVHLELNGGNLNRYREILVDKALFKGTLNLMDLYKKDRWEIDELLKKYYR